MKRIIYLFILFFAYCLPAQAWQGVVVHISDSDHMTPAECNTWHKARGWDSCGYNYVIEPDGVVYEARGNKRGAHTKGYNSKYLGICFVSKNKANPAQLETFHNLVHQYELENLPIYPHANFANKECGIELAKQLGLWKVTAYCSCKKCNGKFKGQTASGINPNAQTVACNILPLGTSVSIDGKNYVVQDRGSKKHFDNQKHIDLWMPSHKQALDFGEKWFEVSTPTAVASVRG